jgi:hypothetical protein
MPKFQVVLRGENFPISREGGTKLTGFFTTRYVRAKRAEEAERKAVELVRYDQSLLAMLDPNSSVEPMVYLEEMARIPWWRPLGGKGYTFYPMEES